MNEAESTPSPNRFCKKLGILNAALKASAASEEPKSGARTRWRTRPRMRLSRIRAATIAAGRARLAVRAVAGEEGLGGAAQDPPAGAAGKRSHPAEFGRCAPDHRSRLPSAPPSLRVPRDLGGCAAD